MLFDLISSFRLFNRSQFMRALLFDAQKKKKKKISGLHQFVIRIISIISNVSLFKKIFENRPLSFRAE